MQQVNLYSEILNQQQNQTGIQLLTATLGGLAFLCISFSVYLVWDVSSTETELHQAQQSFYLNKKPVRAEPSDWLFYYPIKEQIR